MIHTCRNDVTDAIMYIHMLNYEPHAILLMFPSIILRIDYRLSSHVCLETVETVEHRPESLRHALPKLWLGSITQIVLKKVAGTASVPGGRRAIAPVEGAALNLEVVFAYVH